MDCALPLYGNTLQNSELAQLEQLQYRVAKIVTGTFHFTSPEKLIDDLGWKTIKNRIEILGLCIFQKILKYELRPLIKNAAKRSRQHPENNTGNMPSAVFALSINKSLDPTPI